MANRWEGPRHATKIQKNNRLRIAPEPFTRIYVCRCGRTIRRGVLAAQAGVERYTCKRCTRRKRGQPG